ncbi:MAG: hypothetical protein ABI569_11695 [Casimicrobiaceae bacterium]
MLLRNNGDPVMEFRGNRGRGDRDYDGAARSFFACRTLKIACATG